MEKLAYDSSAIDELCSELAATFTKQLGATVISPIASDDVHFRSSSIAAGCNYTQNNKQTIHECPCPKRKLLDSKTKFFDTNYTCEIVSTEMTEHLGHLSKCE